MKDVCAEMLFPLQVNLLVETSTELIDNTHELTDNTHEQGEVMGNRD